MDYVHWIERLGVTLTPEQHIAFVVLESRGLRFLVHFGLQNAVSMADGILSRMVH